DVDVQPNELGCDGWKQVGLSVRGAVLHDEIAPLDIAQLRERAFQRSDVRGHPFLRHHAEVADAVHASRLLCRSGEGGRKHSRDGPKEHAPVHYSTTWSARARSDCGIVSPSALAVLRLITRSNLVGCSIGSSLGRDPRRMRSTKYAARRPSAAGLAEYA